MGKKPKPIGPLAVSRIEKRGLHFVGTVAGLALQVAKGGSRSWVLRATIAGKRRDVGLGGYPDEGTYSAGFWTEASLVHNALWPR